MVVVRYVLLYSLAEMKKLIIRLDCLVSVLDSRFSIPVLVLVLLFRYLLLLLLFIV